MNDKEPEITHEVLSDIPKCLHEYIEMLVGMQPYLKGIKPLRVPSKTLASRIINLHWGITEEEKAKHEILFTPLSKECYKFFQHLMKQKKIEWSNKDETFIFQPIMGYEDSDNIVLEFVPVKKS